jgi:hypothetical protein
LAPCGASPSILGTSRPSPAESLQVARGSPSRDPIVSQAPAPRVRAAPMACPDRSDHPTCQRSYEPGLPISIMTRDSKPRRGPFTTVMSFEAPIQPGSERPHRSRPIARDHKPSINRMLQVSPDR